MFNKNDIIIGGPGEIVEIDESLFIKGKHNRGADTRREKVWVFGLYERATEDEPKRVLFFKAESRNAITLLNIIYETKYYGNENPEPLTQGNIENLHVPLNMSSQIAIRQASTVERSPSPSSPHLQLLMLLLQLLMLQLQLEELIR